MFPEFVINPWLNQGVPNKLPTTKRLFMATPKIQAVAKSANVTGYACSSGTYLFKGINNGQYLSLPSKNVIFNILFLFYYK